MNEDVRDALDDVRHALCQSIKDAGPETDAGLRKALSITDQVFERLA